MIQKKSTRLLIAFFLLIITLYVAKFFSILSFSDNRYIVRIERTFPTQSSEYPHTKDITLFANNKATQKFVAERNNLNQINISFDNFPKHLNDKMMLLIGDENCQPIYSESFGYFSFWRDSIFTRFSFPAIADSAGKTYCLQAEFMPKTPRTDDLPRISTFRSEPDSIFNSGEKQGAGKVFNRESFLFKAAYSAGSFWNNADSLIHRLSQNKPPFFKGVSLAMFLFLSFVSIIVLTVVFLIIL